MSEVLYIAEDYMTVEAIAHDMRVYRSQTQKSMLEAARNELRQAREALSDADALAKAYNIGEAENAGIKAAHRQQIDSLNKAISKMQNAKAEYEKQEADARRQSYKNRGKGWL